MSQFPIRRATAPTRVVTDTVRLCYCFVQEPREGLDGGEPKYSVQVLVPKADTATVQALQAAINEAVNNGVTSKWQGKKPANLKLPLRDGDAEHPGDDIYQGHWFFNATTKTQPGTVGADRLPCDPSLFYSGCFARVSVNFYPYAVSGSRGIAAGLGNLMFVMDGDRLAGGATAEQDFGSPAHDDFGLDDDMLD